jgi:hypothetical protein
VNAGVGANATSVFQPGVVQHGYHTVVDLANPADVSYLTDTMAQKLVGRRATPEEKQNIYNSLVQQGMTEGLTRYAATEQLYRDYFDQRVAERDQLQAAQAANLTPKVASGGGPPGDLSGLPVNDPQAMAFLRSQAGLAQAAPSSRGLAGPPTPGEAAALGGAPLGQTAGALGGGHPSAGQLPGPGMVGFNIQNRTDFAIALMPSHVPVKLRASHRCCECRSLAANQCARQPGLDQRSAPTSESLPTFAPTVGLEARRLFPRVSRSANSTPVANTCGRFPRRTPMATVFGFENIGPLQWAADGTHLLMPVVGAGRPSAPATGPTTWWLVDATAASGRYTR